VSSIGTESLRKPRSCPVTERASRRRPTQNNGKVLADQSSGLPTIAWPTRSAHLSVIQLDFPHIENLFCGHPSLGNGQMATGVEMPGISTDRLLGDLLNGKDESPSGAC